jgi:hypothetical protein
VGVAAEIAGRVAGDRRLERGVQVVAADRVQVAGQVDAAVGGYRHPERPRPAGGVVQRPVGVDAGDPAVPGQPRLGGDHAVGAGGGTSIGGGDAPGLQRAQPVERALQHGDSLQQRAVGELVGVQGAEIQRGELVEQRPQLRHRRPPPPLSAEVERMSEE